MKKTTYTLICILCMLSNFSHAQLADGATAPDFTFADMNGVSHNLYSYLNQGKYVAIDIFATWCGPCWEYHTDVKTMHYLYEAHDTPGDKTWKIFAIEGDPKTTDDDVRDSLDDWTEDTPFPILNPPPGPEFNKFKTGYKYEFFPTLFVICPNKKVYNMPNYPWPLVKDWEAQAAKNCGITGIDNIEDKNPLTIYPNPAKDNVRLYFNLNSNGTIKLQVVNLLGETLDVKDFGSLNAGDQSLKYSTGALSPGMYFFIINANNTRYIAKKVMVQ